MTNITVGQKLWLVTDNYLIGNLEVTVTRVGRKWAHIDWRRERFNIETGWIDGGLYSSPGKVYYSEQQYEREISHDKRYFAVVERLKDCSPDGISEDTLITIEKLLK